MGKKSTAARHARRSQGQTRRASFSKIANKKSQRTPKAVRKQQNRSKQSKEEQFNEKFEQSERRLSSLSWKNFENKIKQETTLNNNSNDDSNNNQKKRTRGGRGRKRKRGDDAKDSKDAQDRAALEQIDFSTYDREIQDDLDLDDEDENELANGVQMDKQDKKIMQFEMDRINDRQLPFSWDQTKDRLPKKSATTGEWMAVQDTVVNKDADTAMDELYNNPDLIDDEDDEDESENENESDDDAEDVQASQEAKSNGDGNNDEKDGPADENDDEKDFDLDVTQIEDYLNLQQDEDEMDVEMVATRNENEEDEEEEDFDLTKEELNNKKNQNNGDERIIMSASEWKRKKRERRELLKLEIADLGQKILKDPYINCKLMELLYSILSSDEDVEVVQYAMLSMSRSIIDIMPPYRIGTMSNDSKLKKENERVRDFEQTLLKMYEMFLKFLFKSQQIFHSKVNSRRMKREASRFIIARCAVKCSCLFLRKASHFNYTKEVIKRTIPLLNSNDKWVRNEAFEAMCQVLSHEPINNVTVEAVSSICGKIESRNFVCSEESIDVLLSLPLKLLHPPDAPIEDEKEKPTKSKRDKKLEAMVSKDLKELDSFDKVKEFERQKVIIESIFGIYFYILKVNEKGELLACALRGMAKFAQLVNVELVVNLVAVISDKLENDQDFLSIEAKLNCILTTFGCLTGRGTAIEMDLKQHYCVLYGILFDMIYPYHWRYFDLVLDCITYMFGKKSNCPVERSAAFIKRLMTLSLHLPCHLSIGCMHAVRKIMILDNRLQCMLDREGGYDGVFDKFNDNPDFTKALGCCLWEFVSDANHFHLFAKQYGRDLCKLNDIPVYLAVEMPKNVAKSYDSSQDGCFKPSVIDKNGKSQQRKYSLKRQISQAKQMDNDEAVKDMIDNWFKDDEYDQFDEDEQVGLEKNEKNEMKDRYFGIQDENVVDECLEYFLKCNSENCKIETLEELKEQYLTLNEDLMMQD